MFHLHRVVKLKQTWQGLHVLKSMHWPVILGQKFAMHTFQKRFNTCHHWYQWSQSCLAPPDSSGRFVDFRWHRHPANATCTPGQTWSDSVELFSCKQSSSLMLVTKSNNALHLSWCLVSWIHGTRRRTCWRKCHVAAVTTVQRIWYIIINQQPCGSVEKTTLDPFTIPPQRHEPTVAVFLSTSLSPFLVHGSSWLTSLLRASGAISSVSCSCKVKCSRLCHYWTRLARYDSYYNTGTEGSFALSSMSLPVLCSSWRLGWQS